MHLINSYTIKTQLKYIYSIISLKRTRKAYRNLLALSIVYANALLATRVVSMLMLILNLSTIIYHYLGNRMTIN